MRNLIFILASIELALFLLVAYFSNSARTTDGRLAAASITLVGLVLAVFLTPALILAISRRGLKTALVLTLIPPILYIILIGPGAF